MKNLYILIHFFQRQDAVLKKPLLNQFSRLAEFFGHPIGLAVFVRGNQGDGAVGVVDDFIADDFIILICAFGAQIPVLRINAAEAV